MGITRCCARARTVRWTVPTVGVMVVLGMLPLLSPAPGRPAAVAGSIGQQPHHRPYHDPESTDPDPDPAPQARPRPQRQPVDDGGPASAQRARTAAVTGVPAAKTARLQPGGAAAATTAGISSVVRQPQTSEGGPARPTTALRYELQQKHLRRRLAYATLDVTPRSPPPPPPYFGSVFWCDGYAAMSHICFCYGISYDCRCCYCLHVILIFFKKNRKKSWAGKRTAFVVARTHPSSES